MVSDKRIAELSEINKIESIISKQIKEENPSKELLSKIDIEVKTELSEEEISIIARLKFLCDELGLENFRKALVYYMELKVSHKRKGRTEYLESIKREQQVLMGQNNQGFNNGRFNY